MESFNRGNVLYIDEEYEDAERMYTSSIQDLADFAPVYANRAACYVKLKKYTSAIEDCDRAIALDPSISQAFYRKGLATFALEEYESAKKAFESGLSLREAESKEGNLYKRAIRKCDADLQCIESKPISSVISATKTEIPSTSIIKASSSSLPTPLPPRPATRYEYYQSVEKMGVSVLAKNFDPSKVAVAISVNRLRVDLTHPDGKIETVIDKQLYAQIDPEKSGYEVRKTKVEICLLKLDKSHWPSLDGSASDKKLVTPSTDGETVTLTTPALVSASPVVEATATLPKPYASRKDWNQVTTEIQKELEAEKPEGEEALQTLFRDIYSKADEDTRRAMNKSFQTSGGTVLSTNWKEVKAKNYDEEKQAPKGVEWRSWEGEKLKQIED